MQSTNDERRANSPSSLAHARSFWVATSGLVLVALTAGAGCTSAEDDAGTSEGALRESTPAAFPILLDGGFRIVEAGALLDAAAPGDAGRTDSGAPVDAGPFPGDCERCPNVTVNCVPPGNPNLPDGAYASSIPLDCKVYLPVDVCSAQGWDSGVYTNEAFQQANQCQALWEAGTTGQPLKDFTDSCCAIRHEYGHICDPRYADGGVHPGSQCTERTAEDSEQTCQDQVLAAACSDSKTLSSAEKQACGNACAEALGREVDKLWDNCMCNASLAADPGGANPSHLNSDTCCTCVSECDDPARALSLLPAFCQGYDVVKDDLSHTVSDDCVENAVGVRLPDGGNDANAGHGCGYYHGPSNFSPGACGKRCVADGELDISVLGGSECEASGPYVSYLYGTAEQSTCAAMGSRYGGTFHDGETSALTVHNLSHDTPPVMTCTYQEIEHYCAEDGWQDYPDDVPAKICPPPNVENTCVGTGVTCM